MLVGDVATEEYRIFIQLAESYSEYHFAPCFYHYYRVACQNCCRRLVARHARVTRHGAACAARLFILARTAFRHVDTALTPPFSIDIRDCCRDDLRGDCHLQPGIFRHARASPTRSAVRQCSVPVTMREKSMRVGGGCYLHRLRVLWYRGAQRVMQCSRNHVMKRQ